MSPNSSTIPPQAQPAQPALTWGAILAELKLLHAVQQQGGLPANASPFDLVRRKYLSALAAYTQRNVILYAADWMGGAEGTSIGPDDMQGFMEVVHGLQGHTLDLVLHSPGGSAEAAEAIVNYLRTKFDDIRIIVPQAAMSAATMLACAADRIVLGKHSALGPIDPQMLVPGPDGVSVSPAHSILEQFKMAKAECAKDPSALPVWLPILRQYGPALLVKGLSIQMR